MKNAFAIVTFSVALTAGLSACATSSPQDAAAPAAASDTAAAAPATAASAAAPADQVLDTAPAAAAAADAGKDVPNVALSSDLMYKLTKAELQFKQGEWEAPFITLMGVAQQTRDPRIAHRAAEMALSAKQGGAALAAIRLWHQLAPDSDEATQYFVGFVVMTDQMEEVEPIFVERLKRTPPPARGVALFQMQQVMARAKDKLVAFAITERLVAPYLDMFEAHLVLAQGALSLDERAHAIREAQQALALKPDSELAALTLAQMTGEPAGVAKVLTDFLDKYPNALEVRGAYARVLAEQQQFGKAREQFQILLKKQPDSLSTLYALGIISVQMNEVPAAEGYFKQFLAVMAAHPKADGDAGKVLAILAQIAEDRGDYAGAIAWLDKIPLSDSREYVNSRIKRAQLQARAGDLDAARKALADIKTDDASVQAQVTLTDAQLLRDAGYDKLAFSVLENGVQRFPGNPDLLYDFALAAEKVDKLDLMEASLLQVIRQVPNSRHAYNALGYSLAERNVRLPEAYELIDKALKMAPDDPFIMDSMGWVQYRMGHLAEAEDYLRRAYALRNDPEIAVHLGEVLWKKGDQSGAKTLWREAKAKDPKNDALKNTLARLNQKL